jgi:hypothetical protein
MKPRHVVYINIVFIGLMLFSAGMVYQFMTGKKPLSMLQSFGHHNSKVTVKTSQCTNKQPLNLTGVETKSLQKLAVYQQACHSLATDTMMIFTSIPASNSQAQRYADEDAVMLKDFAKHGVRPVVIAEPTDKDGTNLDFVQLANGSLNPVFETYFTRLKSNGITDEQLGIWNPFPEANLPYWQNSHPQYFSPAVNNYLTALKAQFPQAHTSILLNSATYENTDFNWENGDYESLVPYVKDIKPGLVEYAGLQGFPWMASQDGAASIFNAAEFLNPDLLVEMAEHLGTKKVWFNTGTFESKYTLDPSRAVTVQPERRKAIFSTVNEQALALQKQGYQVAVNVFAEDKSKTSEETNWSYWNDNRPFNSTATPVITDFINQINSEKINFWLFDK